MMKNDELNKNHSYLYFMAASGLEVKLLPPDMRPQDQACRDLLYNAVSTQSIHALITLYCYFEFNFI